ncbi:EAL domain protein [Marinomonas aquimarina]|uniref:EAL domain protein n=1 Tax=Marinomonas aquimarina TaxID=295068 RepID=A0A1A8T9P8_9GAMM|nr:HDOD domain-containing protein [Marinomonas aquimarina]SBS28736.1 EAL domain protein [Marinomonas aquimarina]
MDLEKYTNYDELMMAQQPIYDRHKKLFGYELLFRGEHEDRAVVDNPEVATSQVLVNLCIGISELEVQTRRPFFINMTSDLVLSDAFFPISPETVYIEILEDQPITPAFVEAVKGWFEKGFRFVLDDYQFSAEYAPLLPYVSMVKVDVLSTPPHTVLGEIEALKQRKIQLIAEKVENQEMFQVCSELGFEYYQGYFLSRPEIVKGKRIEADVQSALRLLNTLQNEAVSMTAVAQLVGQSPTLSYQMLRLLNSPVVGLTKNVESIKEAVVYIGLEQLKRWSMLITLSSQKLNDPEVLKMLLIRARCCELLAAQSKSISTDQAFTVGMISGMDRILQISKQELLSQVALNRELQSAILEFEGPLGRILFSATSIEEERWDRIAQLPTKVRGYLNAAFFDALQWANKITVALK